MNWTEKTMVSGRLGLIKFGKKRWAEIPAHDAAGLRRFGLVTAGTIVGLFALGLPWLLSKPFPVWPWVIAGFLGAWALLAPGSLKLVYYGWMTVVVLLGWLNTRLIIGIVFFLVVLPMGVVMRLVWRDPLALKYDAMVPSYRVLPRGNSMASMEKPF